MSADLGVHRHHHRNHLTTAVQGKHTAALAKRMFISVLVTVLIRNGLPERRTLGIAVAYGSTQCPAIGQSARSALLPWATNTVTGEGRAPCLSS